MYALQFAAVGLHGDEKRRDEKFPPERSPRVYWLGCAVTQLREDEI